MTLKFILAGLALLMLAAWLYVRLNPLDVKALHLDPETADRPTFPGHALLRPGSDLTPQRYDITPAELAARIEAIILATPGTERIAGSLETGFATYVTRSRLWGFPDIANVKVVASDGEEGGAELRILSRLIYGYADMNANRTRLEGWLSQL